MFTHMRQVMDADELRSLGERVVPPGPPQGRPLRSPAAATDSPPEEVSAS